MFTAAEINAAIEQGRRVTARAADVPRKHQPRPGVEVELTEAFERGKEIRASARGFSGRFRVTDVYVEGTETAPDTY